MLIEINHLLNFFFVRPGPNNTVIIIIVTNGTIPNITLANVLNITSEPTKSI